MAPTSSTLNDAQASTPATEPVARHLRQALLWPVRLMPTDPAKRAHHGPWQVLRELGEASPWREEVKDHTGDSARFQERHYNEFVSFLPYVQRFLYGEGRSPNRRESDAADNERDSPMRVFRRRDVSAVRVVAREGDAPLLLDVVHCDLYFFFDVDVVMLHL